MAEPQSDDFDAWELRCKCPICQQEVPNECDPKAVAALQAVRDEVGFPLILNSAYRCELHPMEARKAKPGTHHQGIAFDIRVPWGGQRIQILEAALKHGFKGFGFANGFLHIDYRNEFASWDYK